MGDTAPKRLISVSDPTTGHAADWEATWSNGIAPGELWDIGVPYKPLIRLFPSLQKGTALVPGCGRGHDVASLARGGWDATGLDSAPSAVATGTAFLEAQGVSATSRVLCEDFFTHTPSSPYDVVFDYTMLCAIPPSRRTEWAAAMNRVLRVGGSLVCAAFPLIGWPRGNPEDPQRGPPFQLSRALYHELLVPAGFSCVLDEPVAPEESAAVRAGAEAVLVFVKG